MREKMKRFAGVMLAVLMMLMVCIPVVTQNVEAASSGNYSITIKNSVENYTYYAYQIFTGDYDATEGKLSNIVWGEGVDSAKLLTAIQSATIDKDSALYGLFGTVTDDTTATELADILSGYNKTYFSDNSAASQEFAIIVQSCIIESKKIAFE